MSLLLAATIAAQVIPIAEINLAAPDLYMSPSARAAVDSRAVTSLTCVALPKRSRQFRTACMTKDEWQAAAKETELSRRAIRTPEELNGLPYTAPPPPTSNPIYKSH